MSKFICKNCGNIFQKEIKTAKIPNVQCPKCKSLFTQFVCPDNANIKVESKIQTNASIPNVQQVNFNQLLNEFLSGVCNPQMNQDIPGRRSYIQ